MGVPEEKVHDRLIHGQMTSRARPGGIMGCCTRDISNKINAVLRVMNICGSCTIFPADFASLLTGARSPLMFKRNASHIGHRGHRAC